MAPAIWTEHMVLLVGGLTEIGFVGRTATLLVVSHQGRGLFDCATGERLARDRDEDASRWFDSDRPAALGIGSADGQWIDVWGLAGGEPITITHDGWRATRDGNDVVLQGPTGEQRFSTGVENLRAFGFSPDGSYLVLATPGDLALFARS